MYKRQKISCEINLDGAGQSKISTQIGFFDHMLELLSHHSLIDINLKCEGDTNVDLHHSVEDTAYAIALAINKALDDKKGINRYGFSYVPMDECLSRCVIDLSGRPEIVWNVKLGLKKIGEMDTELFHEFFKAFAKSLRFAVEIDNRRKDIIPSSKGTL